MVGSIVSVYTLATQGQNIYDYQSLTYLSIVSTTPVGSKVTLNTVVPNHR